jgi:hypothetical protein
MFDVLWRGCATSGEARSFEVADTRGGRSTYDPLLAMLGAGVLCGGAGSVLAGNDSIGGAPPGPRFGSVHRVPERESALILDLRALVALAPRFASWSDA